MIDDNVTQLIVLGNGFDLHFGQKTRFENYIEKFNIYDEVDKLNSLFNSLRKLGLKNTSSTLVIQEYFDDNDHIEKIIAEVIDYVDNLKLDVSKEEMLKFYIKSCCNQFSIQVIPQIKEDMDSTHPNLAKERMGLFNEMIRKLNIIFGKSKSKIKKLVRVTFWDVYIKNKNGLNKNSNWSDVERQLLDFYNIETYQYFTDKLTKYESLSKVIQSFKNKPLRSRHYADNDFWLIIYTWVKDFGFSKVNIDNYLYNELVKFSKNFVAFLGDQFDSQRKDSEDRKISEFVNSIAMDNEKFELLNFNYTEIESDNCVKQIHIHGSIKDLNVTPPIIGINVNDLNNNVKNNAFKMTKQYQLIVAPADNKLDLTNISTIVFYGHSLALADYQYFKNIFDRVDLLKSSVRLIFKYSIFDPERKEEIQKGNYDSVYNLLKHYSDDTGVDVITTLILENRLKLQEI
ncbi:MAG TPA: hypothetical protein H9861_04850 [Candidatus Ligilactobacillus excrementigallinarum]|uniref:Bacteriophage abortive infection AbiH n=1 Tax=Candidatus Ligilactobacillus excrementigallinarum TaxID=2838641 RepID=A0A9D2AAR7_9LACO|nr:hypothetical protein [Candidatus Ligilactobacillus excrementigallinarum]